jgi:cAMP-dependent protein kinase regulator
MLGILNKTQQKVQSNLKGAFGQFNLRNKSTSSVDDEDHHHPDGSVDGAAVEGKPITWGMKLRKARVAGGVRFKNVFVAPIVNVNAVLGFTAPVHFKTAEESQFLHAALEDRSFIYSRLGSAEQKALVLAFVKFPVPAGTSLYTEGEPGTHVYVLQKGSVAFSSADPTMSESSKNKGDGSVFGELALLHDAPLVSTARTTMDCILWKLEGDTARKILASYAIGSDNETKDLLKTVPLFKTLDDAFLTQIAYSLSPTTYQDGDVIYTKGEMNVSFCIVRTGMAKATDVEIGDAKYEEVIFKAGESFGALAIMNNEPAQGNVVAVGETTVLSVNRDVFLRLFGGMDKLLQASVDRKMLVRYSRLVCVCFVVR